MASLFQSAHLPQYPPSTSSHLPAFLFFFFSLFYLLFDMSRPANLLFSRTLTARAFNVALPRPAVSQQRPSLLTRVPVRSVHAAPKEYNGLQSAAHHFKRQRHMPYFLEYLMWVVFGSEALHLIWLKMDYKEYKEKTAHKTKLLEELIKRIENGEQIDDSLREEIKMVLMNNKHHSDIVGGADDDIDDEYLNHCKCTR